MNPAIRPVFSSTWTFGTAPPPTRWIRVSGRPSSQGWKGRTPPPFQSSRRGLALDSLGSPDLPRRPRCQRIPRQRNQDDPAVTWALVGQGNRIPSPLSPPGPGGQAIESLRGHPAPSITTAHGSSDKMEFPRQVQGEPRHEKEWVYHYSRGRPHSRLGPGLPEPSLESPMPPIAGHRLPRDTRVVVRPILGGLHHEYGFERRAA